MIASPVASQPPPREFQFYSFLLWALMLWPYFAQHELRDINPFTLLLWAGSPFWMFGRLMKRNRSASLAAQGWEHFHCAWGGFLVGLILASLTSFPLFSTWNLPPLWWFLMLIPVVVAHVRFLLMTMAKDEFDKGLSRPWGHRAVFDNLSGAGHRSFDLHQRRL